MDETTLNKIQEVFRKTFENNTLTITNSTTAADIKSWDSLSHMHLLHELEQAFKIEFKFNEISNFKNVGDMAQCIKNKLEA